LFHHCNNLYKFLFLIRKTFIVLLHFPPMLFEGGFFSGTGILIISAIIIAIWVLIEVKRFKHKIFAIFLMVAIVFLYFGAFAVFQDREVDFGSVSGIMDATKVYFSWLVNIFGNFKTLTVGAVQLDWKDPGNLTTIS